MANNDAILTIGADTSQLEAALKSAESAVKNSMGQMKGSVDSIGNTFKAMQGQFLAFSAAIAGGTAFKSFVTQSIDATKEAVGLGKALGITATEGSVLAVAMNKIGLDGDTVKAAAGKMTQSLLKNEASFKSLGVETRAAGGGFRSTLDIMLETNQALMGFKEGTDRNIEGTKIYGRTWKEVGPLLKLNTELMVESKRRAEELGLVVGQENVEALLKYKANMADAGDVTKAVGKVIGDAVLPEFNAMGHWMAEAGPTAVQGMRAVMDAFVVSWHAIKDSISAVVDALVEIVKSMGAALSDVFGTESPSAMEVFKNSLRLVETVFVAFRVGVQEVISAVQTNISAAVNSFVTLATVAQRALNFDFSGAKSAWQKGMDENVRILRAGGEKMLEIAKKGREDLNKALTGDIGKTPVNTPTKTKDGKGSDGADGANAKDNQVSEWAAALAEKKLALQEAAQLEGHVYEMSKSDERAYWQTKLDLTDGKGKEWIAVRAKIAALGLGIMQDELAAQLSSYKTGEEAAGHALQAKMAYAQAETAMVTNLHGEQSKQAEEARAHEIKIAQEIATQKRAIADELANRERTGRQMAIDGAEQEARFMEQMGQITKAQLLEQEQKFAQARFEIEAQAMAEKLALLKADPTSDPVQAEKLESQLLEIRRKYALMGADLSRQLAIEQQAPMQAVANTMEQSFGKAVEGMLMRAQTLRQGLAGIFSSVLSTFMSEMITKPLAQTAMRVVKESSLYQSLSAMKIAGFFTEATAETGAAAVSASVVIPAKAGEAAAGAAAAVAPTPIIGPVLAAGAFAATMALVMGALKGPGFAVGSWDVPGDMITKVHKGETIVPAKFAEKFRDGGGEGGGGGVHVHVHTQSTQDFKNFLTQNSHVLAPALRNLGRNFTPGMP